MPTPTWRPPPDTSDLDEDSEEGMLEAASRRNAHRNLMAIRWRDQQARAEDKQSGRLPENWHDWMRCPAPEGYQTRGCTCDSWYQTKKRKRYYSPTLHQTHEGRRQLIQSPASPSIDRLVIKTIDLRLGVPILFCHDHRMQMGRATVPANVQVGTIRPKGRAYHYCHPTWLGGKRCRVPGVRRRSHRAHRV